MLEFRLLIGTPNQKTSLGLTASSIPLLFVVGSSTTTALSIHFSFVVIDKLYLFSTLVLFVVD